MFSIEHRQEIQRIKVGKLSQSVKTWASGVVLMSAFIRFDSSGLCFMCNKNEIMKINKCSCTKTGSSGIFSITINSFYITC